MEFFDGNAGGVGSKVNGIATSLVKSSANGYN